MQEWPMGTDEKPPSGVSAHHLVARSLQTSPSWSARWWCRLRHGGQLKASCHSLLPPRSFAQPAADQEIWDCLGQEMPRGLTSASCQIQGPL